MGLVDQIYETAFAPELWSATLTDIATLVGASSAAFTITDRRLPPLYAVTPNLSEFMQAFSASPYWYDNPRIDRALRLNYAGFMEQGRFTTDDERQTEFAEPNLHDVGTAWQAGSLISMPGGELVVFNFVRPAEQDNFSPADIALLDGLRPHLARASLLATRLRLERAEASVEAMGAVGIPAAVIAANGVVIACNTLFETLGDVLRPAAFGRIVARDRDVDRLLQAALPGASQELPPQVRSVPMRSNETDRAVVVHVVPLHRSASDIFERGTALVAISGYSVDGNVPSDAVLRGLFDLSAAEAGVATELAAGNTVKEVALQRGISLATVRTHLAQIFRKTGTRQQGELIALLKGSHSFVPPASQRYRDKDQEG